MEKAGHRGKQNSNLVLQGVTLLSNTLRQIHKCLFREVRPSQSLASLFLRECVPYFSLAHKLEHRLQGQVSQFEMHLHHKSSLRSSTYCTSVLCHTFLTETKLNSYFCNFSMHWLHGTVLSDQKYVQKECTYY